MTTTTPSQTLAAGVSIPQSYGRFGASGANQVTPLDRALIMILGFKGEGKTSLFQHNPGALIINADGSTAPRPRLKPGEVFVPPKAQVWPARDPKTGLMVGVDGKPMTLDGAAVMALKNTLIEAAEKNLPRPTQIIMDSVTAFVRLFKNYIVDQSVALGISREAKENWRNLQGQSAYDVLYDLMVDFTVDLWSHGYGVVWPVHLQDARIRVPGQDGQVLTVPGTEMALTEKFLARITPYMELIGRVERRRRTETTTVIQKIPIGGGKFTEVPKPVHTVVDERVLRFTALPNSEENHERILTSRFPMPAEIVLGSTPWDDFKAAYDKAAATIEEK